MNSGTSTEIEKQINERKNDNITVLVETCKTKNDNNSIMETYLRF